MDEPELRCSGQLAFGPWWLLYSGAIEPMEPHAHHAFQIVVHAGLACVVDGRDLAMPGPIVLVDPYEPHRFVDQSDPVLIAFVDPDSTVGDLLASHRAVSKGPLPLISEKRLASAHPGTWQQAEETVHRMFASVCNPSVTGLIGSWREPSIDAASTALASLVEEVRHDVAGTPSGQRRQRSDDDIGTSPRPFRGWLRLLDGALRLRLGQTTTQAAHAAGFADAAHFAGAFHAMFGFRPEEAVRVGTWLWP